MAEKNNSYDGYTRHQHELKERYGNPSSDASSSNGVWRNPVTGDYETLPHNW